MDNTAGLPRRGPPLASPLPAQLRSAPAGPGPAPPRLRPRRCSLIARAPRGARTGGGRCGPQASRVLPGADPGPPGARLRCG